MSKLRIECKRRSTRKLYGLYSRSIRCLFITRPAQHSTASTKHDGRSVCLSVCRSAVTHTEAVGKIGEIDSAWWICVCASLLVRATDEEEDDGWTGPPNPYQLAVAQLSSKFLVSCTLVSFVSLLHPNRSIQIHNGEYQLDYRTFSPSSLDWTHHHCCGRILIAVVEMCENCNRIVLNWWKSAKMKSNPLPQWTKRSKWWRTKCIQFRITRA